MTAAGEVSAPVLATELTSERLLTEDELVEMRSVFNRLDREHINAIETVDLGDALRCLGCNPVQPEVDLLIAEAEAKLNDSGKLEFLEFSELIAKHRKSLEQEEEELKNAFKALDKNGDGTVNREELKLTMLRGGGWDVMPEEELDAVLDIADTGGNGILDTDELVRTILSLEHHDHEEL